MVELSKELIETLNELNKVLEKSRYRINKFEVSNNAFNNNEIIMIDIRRELKQESSSK